MPLGDIRACCRRCKTILQKYLLDRKITCLPLYQLGDSLKAKLFLKKEIQHSEGAQGFAVNCALKSVDGP